MHSSDFEGPRGVHLGYYRGIEKGRPPDRGRNPLSSFDADEKCGYAGIPLGGVPVRSAKKILSDHKKGSKGSP